MNSTADLREKIAFLRNLEPEENVEDQFKRIPLGLLKGYRTEESVSAMEASVLESKLQEFGFCGKVENVRKGPLITQYEIRLAAGVRLSQIRKVSEDLAVALMSDRIRIQAPIPGTSLVGIEVANESSSLIGLKEIIKAARRSHYDLPIAIGVDIAGNPKIVDLAKLPHLLIAGRTGSRKSVGINAMILSILFTKTPEECRLILVDPKRVEMTPYEGLPHLAQPVVTEPEQFYWVFDSLIKEMDQRYQILRDHKVRNIVSYNRLEGITPMPYQVVVVDEMADMIMTHGKLIEKNIVRLAQLARAVGIHLILATQKPSVTVITGLIKGNMPSRISYHVASKTDSRVILDSNGAEKLLGRGDLLMVHPGCVDPERFHGAWVSDKEIQRVCEFLRGR